MKKCRAYALKDVSGLIEFLGYTFCFSNLLAGPTTEYATYLKSIDGSIFKTHDGKSKVPSNLLPTIKPLITCLINLGVFLTLRSSQCLILPIHKTTLRIFLRKNFCRILFTFASSMHGQAYLLFAKNIILGGKMLKVHRISGTQALKVMTIKGMK